MLKVHQVLLTFPFCLSIKHPPVKHIRFVLAQHSCCLGEPAELLKGTTTCEEVPYLKGTRKKIIQLPLSAKASRQIPPLAHDLSPPRLHRPQPAQQNTRQNSIMAICGLVAWERRHECHCHGRLEWHSPSLGDSQSSPSETQTTHENETKGLRFH